MTASSTQPYLLADNAPVPPELEKISVDADFINGLRTCPAAQQKGWYLFGPDTLEDAFEDMDGETTVLTERLSPKDKDIDESDPTADAIKDLSPEQRNRKITWTTNLVGFVRNDSGSVQLSISSRFSKCKEADGTEKAVPIWEDRFLAYMMDQVLHFNVLNLDFASQPDRSWHHLLVLLFPTYLERAMEKGLLRQYVRREHNDSAVRGRIDIARHIRENAVPTGNIAYVTREFDADNPVTELIRHTIEYIDRLPFGRQLLGKESTRKLVRQIRQATPRYQQGNLSRVLAYNRRHSVNHPYYHEYRTLQQLCQSILSHGGVQFSGEDGQRFNGFIVDCAWLWEEYLNTVLKGNGFDTRHPRNKARDKAHGGDPDYYFSDGVGLIFPDFLFREKDKKDKKEKTPIIVGDAKYKPQENVNGRDYQQVVSYLARFESDFGLYLYPEASMQISPQKKELRLAAGWRYKKGVAPQHRRVCKLGLPVGSEADMDYVAFCDLMKQRETQLIDRVRDYVKHE